MIVYTDSISYGNSILNCEPEWRTVAGNELSGAIGELSGRLFSEKKVCFAEIPSTSLWRYLFLAKQAEESQFDALRDMSSELSELPAGILCCADSGQDFHGFRGRPWVAVSGNLHLSAFLRPDREMEASGMAFIMLAVVSVLEALDQIEVLTETPMVKWVNDILIGDAKIGGVLAHVQTQGKRVTSAILGIGLNVEQKPTVSPTPFVPTVAALSEFVDETGVCTVSRVFDLLLPRLQANFRILQQRGLSDLLESYRNRSVVIGREVLVLEDSSEAVPKEITRGRVRSIGECLELELDGAESPVFKGRLIIL